MAEIAAERTRRGVLPRILRMGTRQGRTEATVLCACCGRRSDGYCSLVRRRRTRRVDHFQCVREPSLAARSHAMSPSIRILSPRVAGWSQWCFFASSWRRSGLARGHASCGTRQHARSRVHCQVGRRAVAPGIPRSGGQERLARACSFGSAAEAHPPVLQCVTQEATENRSSMIQRYRYQLTYGLESFSVVHSHVDDRKGTFSPDRFPFVKGFRGSNPFRLEGLIRSIRDRNRFQDLRRRQKRWRSDG
mmetsp:Transcript_1955/g.12313  ORF Transcript_1955/g.12313 Transcript_1955/m.12313 type:complete len:248 (+) Transcript_1955:336-1079(+)